MAHDDSLAIRIPPRTKVHLRDHDPADTKGMKREAAEARTQARWAEFAEMQELLYGAAQQSVLIVLQGMDTSGKDGTIRHVMAPINPQGCNVIAFKEPTPADLAHDFLWRVHPCTPPKGMIGIFNRSHYEDVLVVRVHDLVPEAVWKRRYDAINDFERLLAKNETIILKFFLYISKEEQRARLLAREKEPNKAWKLSPGDWIERENWDDYQAAYEAALSKCSTKDAPWYIVPADKKWFRNLAITETILDTLRPHVSSWQEALAERGAAQRAAIAQLRARKTTDHPCSRLGGDSVSSNLEPRTSNSELVKERPMRLYLFLYGTNSANGTPFPGYLIQTDDGTNILVDTGFPPEVTGAYRTAAGPGPRVDEDQYVLNRLAALGLAPKDIRYLIATHLDGDHAGNHDQFPDAEIVIQKEHLEAARQLERFQGNRAHWDAPGLHYRMVDGDTELLPGIELIKTTGHKPGHQSVLVRLPETGPVLLAIDAIPRMDQRDPETRTIGPADMDEANTRASTRKLMDLAAREGVTLIIHGHDPEQWQTLKLSPDYYS